jgi:hypothetical protein
MSQPNYLVFSKKNKSQQWDKYDKRNRRGAYNFEKTKEYEIAERWFEERRGAQKATVDQPKIIEESKPIKLPPGLIPSSIIINRPLGLNKVIMPPPGLEKIAVELPKFCKKCTRIPTNALSTNCCMSFVCSSCFSSYSELFNRCVFCKVVLDQDRYDEFDGLDLYIPPYEDFEYLII